MPFQKIAYKLPTGNEGKKTKSNFSTFVRRDGIKFSGVSWEKSHKNCGRVITQQAWRTFISFRFTLLFLSFNSCSSLFAFPVYIINNFTSRLKIPNLRYSPRFSIFLNFLALSIVKQKRKCEEQTQANPYNIVVLCFPISFLSTDMLQDIQKTEAITSSPQY